MANLKTVNQMLDKHKFLTVGGFRSLIFNAETNGLNEQKVIVRIGRKILINEDNFFNWLDFINSKEVA